MILRTSPSLPRSFGFTALELIAFVFFGALWPASTEAARPLVTDDARIVAPMACQLETWTLLSRAGDEYWALPACDFIGGVEIAAGVALLPDEPGAGPSKPAVVVQGKTVFRSVTPDTFGIGLVVGGLINAAPVEEEEIFGNVFSYVPLTFPVFEDRAFIHTNAGIAYDATDDRVLGTWGVAGEAYLRWGIFALGEVYGSNDERPFSQVGFRAELIPERVQLDAVYGLQIGFPAEEGWVSVGLRFLSPPLFSP